MTNIISSLSNKEQLHNIRLGMRAAYLADEKGVYRILTNGVRFSSRNT